MDFAYRDNVPPVDRPNHISVEGEVFRMVNGCLSIPDRIAVLHLEEIIAHGFRPGGYVPEVRDVVKSDEDLIADADKANAEVEQAVKAAQDAMLESTTDPESKPKALAAFKVAAVANAAIERADAAEALASPLRAPKPAKRDLPPSGKSK